MCYVLRGYVCTYVQFSFLPFLINSLPYVGFHLDWWPALWISCIYFWVFIHPNRRTGPPHTIWVGALVFVAWLAVLHPWPLWCLKLCLLPWSAFSHRWVVLAGRHFHRAVPLDRLCGGHPAGIAQGPHGGNRGALLTPRC